MLLETTYEKEFESLMSYLKSKYPEELFDLEGIGKQLDMSVFSKNFFRNTSSVADVSVDSNANVDDSSIIAYNVELPKAFFRLNSLYLIWKYLKKLYDIETANKAVEMQICGDIYINDLVGINAPYCYNFSTYDIAISGLPFVNKVKSNPPKHLSSFIGQLIHFTVYASNSVLGAVGLADFLIVTSYYVDKLFRDNPDVPKEYLWRQVKQELQSFIFSCNQPFRSGIQCVTEDTEVLTPQGFKKYYELKEGDEIYTWKDGILEIDTVKRVNVKDYKGYLHQYKGRDVNQVVTPNHRVLHLKNNSDKYILTYSEKLFKTRSPVAIPVAMLDNPLSDYDISDDLLQLLVIILTDGSIDFYNGKVNKIKIFKSPNRYGNELVETLLKNLNIKYSIKQVVGGFDTEVNIYELCYSDSVRLAALLNNTKKQLPDFFFKLSKRQAKLVIDLWSRFDGSVRKRKYSHEIKLQCDNDEIADGLQHVCFLACMGSRKFKRIIGNNKKETIYVVPYNRTNKVAMEKNSVYYEGKVWCPTTNNGVVVFRKDGKVFISGNSGFYNVSIYDKYFLDDLCGTYIFPDGYAVNKETVKKLQELYVDLMSETLRYTPITFPVTTACFSIDENKNIKDKEFLSFIADKNREFGFINMYFGETSTLSACCRLRSSFKNEYFNQLGAGGTKIGSLGVVTINIPRVAIKAQRDSDKFFNLLTELVSIAIKINNVKRYLLKKRIDSNNLPLYKLGFMDLKTQYSTVGLVGLNEACNFMGLSILNKDGQEFVSKILDIVNALNDKAVEQYNAPHNVEQVPAENSAIKLAQKDKLLGYQNEYRLYSNQFIPLTTNANLLDRIAVQGMFDEKMTGGAICHLNVEQRIENPKFIENLIAVAAKAGVVYTAINYNLQKCQNEHMSVGKNNSCSICGSEIVDNFTRVVGFLVNTKNFHKVRREYDYPNRVFVKELELC
jgi:ribonucleoside-triphosphate reductase